MDWLKSFLIKHHLKWLFGLFSLVSLNFIASVINVLQDGSIDSTEFHNLSMQSNGIEMIILLALMAVFKKKP